MDQKTVAALSETLSPHVASGNARRETLSLLTLGMLNARTTNLSVLACERRAAASTASTYRRLQRFFQHVDLGPDWTVTIIARLIGPSGDWTLALDRTSWKIGTRDVNYLVLAVVTRRFRVPLLWTLLGGPGNSGTSTRIALMKRHLARFPASTVRILLADREFIGAEWLKYLNDNNIKFAIRLREDLRVTCDEGFELTLLARLRNAGRTRFFRARIGTREDAAASDAPRLHFAARRLKGEWLIVVSNIPGSKALAAYRKRWAIECLFADAKTRGLNIDDTRLTDPRKLALLMALVALAIVRAGRVAADLIGRGTRNASPTDTSRSPGSAPALTGSETSSPWNRRPPSRLGQGSTNQRQSDRERRSRVVCHAVKKIYITDENQSLNQISTCSHPHCPRLSRLRPGRGPSCCARGKRWPL